MRKLLVTGGTVFVSRYVADYFARRGDDVYVLSRALSRLLLFICNAVFFGV